MPVAVSTALAQLIVQSQQLLLYRESLFLVEHHLCTDGQDRHLCCLASTTRARHALHNCVPGASPVLIRLTGLLVWPWLGIRGFKLRAHMESISHRLGGRCWRETEHLGEQARIIARSFE